MRWWWLLLCLTAPAFADKPIAPEQIPGATRVTAEEVVRLIQTEPELVVIDARRPEEHAKGHIEGAISLLDTDITPKRLAQHIPSRNTPVLFYCNGERCLRSMHACEKAAKAGYEKVFWFRGGWMEWLAKGLPVSR